MVFAEEKRGQVLTCKDKRFAVTEGQELTLNVHNLQNRKYSISVVCYKPISLLLCLYSLGLYLWNFQFTNCKCISQLDLNPQG